MKLIAGLGNPGAEYERTRHNLGFEVLDKLAGTHRASWSRKPDAEIARWAGVAVLLKPQTFMNLSGSALQQWAHFYKVEFEDLLVVVDDVNLESGRLRIRRSGGPGGHNGLKSIIASLGTEQFPRLRIGVGGGSQRNLSPHVLGRFGTEEEDVIASAVQRAVEAIEVFITVGIVAAMDRFNRKDDKTTDDN
ncbi:MAG TPA: aminoacyl-tRNA hydrolase [Vicinamibacterales bacterium]